MYDKGCKDELRPAEVDQVRAQISLEEKSGAMPGQSTPGKVNDSPDSLNTEAWALYSHLEMIRLSGLMWSTCGQGQRNVPKSMYYKLPKSDPSIVY